MAAAETTHEDNDDERTAMGDPLEEAAPEGLLEQTAVSLPWERPITSPLSTPVRSSRPPDPDPVSSTPLHPGRMPDLDQSPIFTYEERKRMKKRPKKALKRLNISSEIRQEVPPEPNARTEAKRKARLMDT